MTGEERLCMACAMCCDGTLFTRVPLEEEEGARLRTRLAVLDTGEGRCALRQRCSALTSDGCTVYGERPKACRSYRCLLLEALAAGEVDLPEALQIVASTRAAEDRSPMLAMYFARRSP